MTTNMNLNDTILVQAEVGDSCVVKTLGTDTYENFITLMNRGQISWMHSQMYEGFFAIIPEGDPDSAVCDAILGVAFHISKM